MRILPQQGVFFMKGLKKKIILFLLMIVMGVSPVFANMPVIDITSIMQAVQGYVQSLQQWQAQLQQWKSEFDRIQKAAKGLSSGDFTQIVSSIASLTKQASNWRLNADMISEAYIGNALSKTSDGAYSLLSLLNNSQLMVKKFDMFLDIIQSNADRMTNSVEKSQNGLEAGAAVGSGMTGMQSSMIQMLMNMVKSGGNIAVDLGNMWNDVATMFDVSPEEYAKIYEEILIDTLDGAIPGARSSDDVQKAIESQQDVIKKAKDELITLNPEEEGTAYTQAQLEVDDAQKLLDNYFELHAWAKEMEQAITEIRGNQADYKKAMDAAETGKARSEANLEMRNAMDAFAKEYNSTARKNLKIAQQDLDAAFGVTNNSEEP